MRRIPQRNGKAVIPFSSVIGGDLGHKYVSEDAAVEEFHDVEWSADDGTVFTKQNGLRNGYLLLQWC